MSEEPVRGSLGDGGTVPVEAGIRATFEAFTGLLERGALTPAAIA